MKYSRIGLIGSASGLGAPVRETEKGPVVVKERGIISILEEGGVTAYWAGMLHYNDGKPRTDIGLGEASVPYIIPQLKSLGLTVKEVMKKGEFPCVIGGDHVMAAGTFSAVVDILEAKNDFGLIWIDAHMDSHTHETSLSNAYHGMPLAALLGHGDSRLTDLFFKGQKLSSENLVLIGIRSYEAAEKTLLDELGVKVIYVDEVKKRGFESVLKEAIDSVSKNTKAFGVSFDLDVFEPEFAPGVGTPEINGLDPKEVLPYLHWIRDHEKYSVLELVEFNPDRDKDDLTALLVEDLLMELLPRIGD